MLGCTKSEKIANVSNNFLDFKYYWVLLTPDFLLNYEDKGHFMKKLFRHILVPSPNEFLLSSSLFVVLHRKVVLFSMELRYRDGLS